MDARYKIRLAVAGVLLLAGVILPLMMVVRVFPASFLLSFLAYASSVSGMFLGIITVMTYTKDRNDVHDHKGK